MSYRTPVSVRRPPLTAMLFCVPGACRVAIRHLRKDVRPSLSFVTFSVRPSDMSVSACLYQAIKRLVCVSSLSIMPRGIMRVSGVSGMGTMLCCGMDDGRRRRIEHGSTKWRGGGGGGEPRQRDERKRATPGSVTWEVVFRDQYWTDRTLSPNLVFIPPFDELCACSYIHRTAVEFRTCVLKKRKGRKTKRRRGEREREGFLFTPLFSL